MFFHKQLYVNKFNFNESSYYNQQSVDKRFIMQCTVASFIKNVKVS